MKIALYLPVSMLLLACGSGKPVMTTRVVEEFLSAEKYSIAFENDAIQGYLVKLPAGYSSEKAYPMMVAFHGAVGSANSAYLSWEKSSVGFILVCPQGTARMGWQIGSGQVDSIMDFVEDVQERFSVDQERIYLTGHSMGGHVCWNLATSHPEHFAAVAPTASTPMSVDNLDKLLALPLYVVHGRNDKIVSLAKNQAAAEFITSRGGSLTLMIIEDAGHGFVEEQRDDIIDFFHRHP